MYRVHPVGEFFARDRQGVGHAACARTCQVADLPEGEFGCIGLAGQEGDRQHRARRRKPPDRRDLPVRHKAAVAVGVAQDRGAHPDLLDDPGVSGRRELDDVAHRVLAFEQDEEPGDHVGQKALAGKADDDRQDRAAPKRADATTTGQDHHDRDDRGDQYHVPQHRR